MNANERKLRQMGYFSLNLPQRSFAVGFRLGQEDILNIWSNWFYWFHSRLFAAGFRFYFGHFISNDNYLNPARIEQPAGNLAQLFPIGLEKSILDFFERVQRLFAHMVATVNLNSSAFVSTLKTKLFKASSRFSSSSFSGTSTRSNSIRLSVSLIAARV